MCNFKKVKKRAKELQERYEKMYQKARDYHGEDCTDAIRFYARSMAYNYIVEYCNELEEEDC